MARLRVLARMSAAALLGWAGTAAAAQADATNRPVEWQAPRFTEAAWRARIAGRVELDLAVDPGGHVVDAVATRKLPMGLDKAAISAAQEWIFAAAPGSERTIHVTVEFARNPEGAWEDGSAWTAAGTLRTWRVEPRHRLERGLAEGAAVDLSSPEALAVISATVRAGATTRGAQDQVLSIGGARPPRELMKTFKDLPRRVYRSPFAVHFGAERVNVERVARSPHGEYVVELTSPFSIGVRHDFHAVESRDGRLVVVESDFDGPPLICALPATLAPPGVQVAAGIYLHGMRSSGMQASPIGRCGRNPEAW